MVRLGVRSFALQAGLRSGWQLAVGEAVSLGGWLVVELAAWMAGWWRGCSLAGQDGCEAVCLVG